MTNVHRQLCGFWPFCSGCATAVSFWPIGIYRNGQVARICSFAPGDFLADDDGQGYADIGEEDDFWKEAEEEDGPLGGKRAVHAKKRQSAGNDGTPCLDSVVVRQLLAIGLNIGTCQERKSLVCVGQNMAKYYPGTHQSIMSMIPSNMFVRFVARD